MSTSSPRKVTRILQVGGESNVKNNVKPYWNWGWGWGAKQKPSARGWGGGNGYFVELHNFPFSNY